MENINWENYNGPAFQLFCNALLSFEIGHHFRPYNAPGSDGGIDGHFDGSYNGSEKGKWRFQYKFHKGARKQGADLLKADLKKEISNIRDENYFIMLTNVELRPQEVMGLEKSFAAGTAELSNAPVFQIWDGAKLFTLFLRFPLLHMWLTEGFSTAQLVDYKTSFEKLLSAPIEKGYTLGNYFASREESIAALENFIDCDKVTTLIIGEAGIGKTRLVIEFFKKIEQERKDYTCLRLISHQFDFDKISLALSGPQTYIILVDDAHEFDPSVIADLSSIAVQLVPKVKLILTARTIQTSNFMTKLKEYDQVDMFKIELGELSRKDTIQIFDHELKDRHLQHYTSELAIISHGKPILIVAILAAAAANTVIKDIKNLEFFNLYVSKYFDAYRKEVAVLTKIGPLKAKQFLQIVSMIEPFSYTDTAIVEKIAKVLNEEKTTIATALDLLKKGSYVSGKYSFSIKPDYYSDILLRNADPDIIHSTVIELIIHIDHIVTNLSTADDAAKEKNPLLDEILDGYLAIISTPGDLDLIPRLFDTMISIAHSKPSVARKAVDLYSAALFNEGHPIQRNFTEFRTYHLQSHDTAIGKICTILWELLYLPEHFVYVYDTVFKLQSVVKEFTLLGSIYQFSKRDYIENYELKRQRYFLSRLRKGYQRLTSEKLLFAIDFLKMFLQHDFTITGGGSSTRHSITITTFYLPNEPNVNGFRTEVINLLIDMYKTLDDLIVKERLMAELVDIPRGIFATTRHKIIYKGNPEIETVLWFIRKESPQIPANLQPEVLEKLYWYERWGIDEQFLPLMADIRLQLKPRNITEQLTQLFSNAELMGEDYRKAEENLAAESRQIIKNNPASEIAESLADIQQHNTNRFYYFQQFLSVLTREFETEAREIYTLLQSLSESFIYQFGAIFLHEQYYSFNNESFYREKVKELAVLNTPEADNTILGVYSMRHASKIKLNAADFAIIEYIFYKNQQPNNFSLSRALIPFIVQQPEKGLTIGLQFLERCYEREADIFFLFLSDNLPEVYDALRTLCLQGSIRFELNYNIEKCLNSILQKEGADAVFNYFVQRFEHKRTLYKERKSLTNYDMLPSPEHSHLCDGLPTNAKYELFEKALRWWLEVPLEPIDFIYSKDLISYLQVTRSVDETLLEIFTVVSEKCKENLKATGRVLDALAVYHDKDEPLINLIQMIYDRSYDLHGDKEEAKKELNYKAFNAITEVGAKSGTVGQPFEIDVNLKNLLEQRLAVTDEFAAFYQLLKSVIKSLEGTIASSYDNDNETW